MIGTAFLFRDPARGGELEFERKIAAAQAQER